jgi:hypothetical protein
MPIRPLEELSLNNLRRSSSIWEWLAVLLLIAAPVGLSWANYQFALANPGGNDFLVHWVGTRTFITEGISPYSDETATRIQVMAYGRPAQPGEHELRVAYPFYSALLFLPYAMIPDYNLARAVWMTTLELGMALTAILSLRLTGWQPGIGVLAVFFLFTFTWYHGVRPLINGNAVILIGLMIVGALLAIRSNLDELAGILLGLSTVKPQVVALVIAFLLVWAVSARRMRIVIWTIGSVVILTLLGMLFIPDWPLQNLAEVLRYPGYNPPGTPGAAFLEWYPGVGRQLGWGLTIVMAGLMLGEWWAARNQPIRWLTWTACLTLAASQWSGIQTDPGNYIVLFLPVTLVLAALQERWRQSSRWITILLLVGLWGGLWALFLNTVEYGAQPQQHPIMIFPLPLIVLIGLYWVRWWAIRPRAPFIPESLRSI